MRKKLMICFLTVSMILGTGVQALAAPITEAQQQELNDKKAQISEAEQKYADLQNKVDEFDNEIQQLILAMQENDNNIGTVNKEIEAINIRIEDNKKDLEEKENIFKSRMRYLYKNGGQTTYLSLLFSANNLADFISKAKAVGKILNLDKEIMKELEEKQQEYNNNMASLASRKKELENLNADNKQKLADLNKKKQEQIVYIEQAKNEYNNLSGDLVTTERGLYKPFEDIINNSNSSIDDLNNSISSLTSLKGNVTNGDVKNEIVNLVGKANTLVSKKKAEIQAQAQANSKNSTQANTQTQTSSRGSSTTQTQKPSLTPPTNTNVTASASKILEIAYSKLGATYVWGATGPDVFDCSGFTQYVYKQAGISISRTTYTQVNDGVAVSYSDLQPGDLVLTSAGHVGIYVGGGQMIHAPQTGDVIKVSKIWSFYAARRIL